MAVTVAEKSQLAPHVSQGTIALSSILTLLPLVDFLVIAGSGLLFYFAYVGYSETNVGAYMVAIFGVATASVFIQRSRGTYDTTKFIESFWQAKNILGVVTVTFGAFVVVAFAFKVSDDFSRIWAFSWYMSAVGLLF